MSRAPVHRYMAADMLSLSRGQLEREAVAGVIEYVEDRDGRKWYRPEDIEKYRGREESK